MLPFVIVSAFVLWAVTVWGSVKADLTGFNQRFPPIEDDEFIARCSPGASRDVALRVRRIVAEQLGVEYERVYPSSRFVDDLGAD